MTMLCMCKKKIVVFDLDDTLYKEWDYVKSGYHFIANQLANQQVTADVIYQELLAEKKQNGAPFGMVLKKYGFRNNVEELKVWYYNHRSSIVLDSDTQYTLTELKKRGVVLGIISDGRTDCQGNKIQALGLLKWIDKTDIIINNQEERKKPDMQSFRTFEGKYGKDADYWYVGDNTGKDFVAPNVLGWTTVCLKNDGRNVHIQDFTLERVGMPEIIIDNLKELL